MKINKKIGAGHYMILSKNLLSWISLNLNLLRQDRLKRLDGLITHVLMFNIQYIMKYHLLIEASKGYVY